MAPTERTSTPPPADKREPLHLRIHQERAIAGTRPALPGPPERDAETTVAINAEDAWTPRTASTSAQGWAVAASPARYGALTNPEEEAQ